MNFPERNEADTKNYLKLKAGESVVGVFRGEVTTLEQHWEGRRSYLCPGDGCSRCKAGNKSLYRFQLNFVTKENAVYVAKVFQQGFKVQKQLEVLNKDYPLEKFFIKITRSGNGPSDTSYSFLPSPNGALTKAQEAEISKVALVVLDPVSEGAKEAAVATDSPDDEGDANENF